MSLGQHEKSGASAFPISGRGTSPHRPVVDRTSSPALSRGVSGWRTLAYARRRRGRRPGRGRNAIVIWQDLGDAVLGSSSALPHEQRGSGVPRPLSPKRQGVSSVGAHRITMFLGATISQRTLRPHGVSSARHASKHRLAPRLQTSARCRPRRPAVPCEHARR